LKAPFYVTVSASGYYSRRKELIDGGVRVTEYESHLVFSRVVERAVSSNAVHLIRDPDTV
jgi:hypothetical protein